MTDYNVHVLDQIGTFTTEFSHVEVQPHGGGIPIHKAITPYSRWYCICGSVGGRSSTPEQAEAAHHRHAAEQNERKGYVTEADLQYAEEYLQHALVCGLADLAVRLVHEIDNIKVSLETQHTK